MIRFNFREIAWEEGLTVEDLLQRMREDKTYRLILRGKTTVIVNNEVISPSEYGRKTLDDGDEMRVYPVMAGG